MRSETGDTITIPMPRPHPAQRQIFNSSVRFQVIFAGRRWGKTELGVDRIIRGVCRVPGLYWWVGLSWRSASMKRAWRLLGQRLRPAGAQIREADKEIRIPNGSEIWLRTAERPDSLSGEGVRGVVLDEFSLMSERIWAEFVRPTLADYRGWAMFIGVPKGRNWTFALYQRGMDDKQCNWASWRLPTSDNPFIPPDEIEAAKRDSPERIFNQEWLAEFVSDAGDVFRGVNQAATATWQEAATDGHSYVMGVDWGKYDDFTVLSVIDATQRACVFQDRFNQIDYTLQLKRLKAVYERFRPDVVIPERNSMGEPLIEQLIADDLPIQPFTTTAGSKKNAVEALALAFERGDLKIIPDPMLLGELQAYEMQRLPSGMLRYTAPGGMHDDCVTALMLAWSGAKAEESMRIELL